MGVKGWPVSIQEARYITRLAWLAAMVALYFMDRTLKGIKCYWHSLDRPEAGLAYHGITLIPPVSIAEMIEVVRDVPEMRRLMEMLVVAERERKFVIHFGV